MKKLFLLVMITFSLSAMAQIEMFDESVKKVAAPQALPYDSLKNVATQKYGSGDKYKQTYHHLIGQTLMYCGNPNYNLYDEKSFEVGVYYRVDSILPNDPRGPYKVHRLQLTNIQTGVIQEEFSGSSNYFNYEWVVLGHYEKIKSLYLNKELILLHYSEVYRKADGIISLEADTVTKNIPLKTVWTCTGVQVKPRKKDDGILSIDKRSPIVLILDNTTYGKHYCYLENEKGEPYIPLYNEPEYICGKFRLKSDYDKDEAEKAAKRAKKKADDAAKKAKRKADLTNRFGAANAELILQGKVKIGMTKEMCIEAWGRPRKINKTTGSWGTHEQWVYGRSYLYFEGNRLTSIQN